MIGHCPLALLPDIDPVPVIVNVCGQIPSGIQLQPDHIHWEGSKGKQGTKFTITADPTFDF